MNTPIHWPEAWHTLRKLRLFFGFIVPADAVAVKIFTDLLFASGEYELLEAPGGLNFSLDVCRARLSRLVLSAAFVFAENDINQPTAVREE